MYLSLALLTKLSIKTEFSPWFIPLCLLLGLIYAYLLYSKDNPWSRQANYILATARVLVVSIIAFLLLGPLLDQITYTEEAPILVINVDDSSSITSEDSIKVINSIEAIQNALGQELVDIRVKGLTSYFDQEAISYTSPTTNLSGSLQSIGQDFEQQNLIGAVLLSDGIHNSGPSPQFQTLTYPLYTVGLGDTIPAKDLSIKKLNFNKVVYQGKQFPLTVDVFNNGYVNEALQVDLLLGNNLIESQTISPTGDQQINNVEFIIDAENIGIKSYSVRISAKPGEATVSNNARRAFIEVIDSEQKILIAAMAPHPDIKALRAVIEAKEGTEVSLWIDGFEGDFPEGPFDLVIYHQLPGFNDLAQEIDHWIDDSNSLFITGTSDLENINRRNQVLTYSNFGQTDQVIGNLAPEFDLFQLDQDQLSRMQDYPPISVPYGTFELKTGAQIMLYQKIGSTETSRPLLSIWNDEERKSAVFSGIDIWRWRLQESAVYDTPDLFDELFGKLIQYLSTTDNKSNFVVEPINERINTSEAIEFNSEVYNDLYEQVYDYNISMKLRDETNTTVEYNYVNSPQGNFNIPNLAPGLYQYEATVTVNNKLETSKGSFSIEELQLENIDLTANHQLLRNIAKNSGGQFYQSTEIEALANTLSDRNPRSITRSSEELNPLINNPLWLILLIVLLSFEWFMRKYYGSY